MIVSLNNNMKSIRIHKRLKEAQEEESQAERMRTEGPVHPRRGTADRRRRGVIPEPVDIDQLTTKPGGRGTGGESSSGRRAAPKPKTGIRINPE